MTATTLLYGRIADILGRRCLFTIVVLRFLGGSILCGFSQSMLQLVIFRTVQCIFAGVIFPLAIGIIADSYPMQRHAQGFSIVPTRCALAAVLGPTAGGFLTDTVGWRWIFFLNIPVVVAALTMFLATFAPAARRPASGMPVRFGDLDFAGFGAFATAVVVFFLALSLGGQQLAWWSVPELLLVCTALVAFSVFVPIEHRARLPLLPLRLLGHRGLGGALLAIFLLSVITNTMIVLIPNFAQGVLGDSARSAEAVLIPMMLSWPLTANVAVRVGQRRGFRAVAVPGVALLIAGLLCLSTVHFGSGQAALVLPMILLGTGAGLVNPNMMVLVDAADAGAAELGRRGQYRLAIQGQGFPRRSRAGGAHPACQGPLELGHAQAGHEPAEQRTRWREESIVWIAARQEGPVLGAPLPDSAQRVTVTQQRRHQAGQQKGQVVPPSPPTARVGHGVVAFCAGLR